MVPHRRCRQYRRRRTAFDSRSQEGDDCHCRRSEHLPRGCRGRTRQGPGVRDSAVVGVTDDGRERVHAVLVLAEATEAADVIRSANRQLEDHQRIRGFSVWTEGELPRTEGTRKLKRRELRAWVTGSHAPRKAASGDDIEGVVAQYAPGRQVRLQRHSRNSGSVPWNESSC